MRVQLRVGELKKKLPELLITILAQKYPLRIKEIHTRLVEDYSIRISFQAVRKALNQLVDQGKLEYEKNEYQINKEWIKENKRLSDLIVKNYFIGENKTKPPQLNKLGD